MYLIRFFLLLPLFLISNAFALDPTLSKQRLGVCYYDDGSVIKSLSCPSRLKGEPNDRSRLRLSDSFSQSGAESAKWRLEFGKQQADRVSQGLRGLTGASTIEEQAGLAYLKAEQKQSSDEAKQRADFADYVSETYGVEGEHLRELIMSGSIDSMNYQLFVN